MTQVMMTVEAPNERWIETEVLEGITYYNLTLLADMTGVRLDNYLANQGTKKFLEALSSSLTFQGGEVKRTNPGSHSGTWVVEEVVHDFLAWVSPEYRVHIMTLMKKINNRDVLLIPTTQEDQSLAMVIATAQQLAIMGQRLLESRHEIDRLKKQTYVNELIVSQEHKKTQKVLDRVEYLENYIHPKRGEAYVFAADWIGQNILIPIGWKNNETKTPNDEKAATILAAEFTKWVKKHGHMTEEDIEKHKEYHGAYRTARYKASFVEEHFPQFYEDKRARLQ